MADEWRMVKVNEIADSISETHPRRKEQLVFLNTSDISFGTILHHSYSPVKNWPGQAKKSIRKGDILFSEIRPANGRYAYVDVAPEDYVVSTKLMVIRARGNQVVPKFLYHFLTARKNTQWLQHLAESRSGTFPQITFDQIAELELSLPPIRDQATIAAFLDVIDNKIQLNRQICETLEAMTHAIFKSWFVDFDPVRAKSEHCQPFGVTAETAALFSDSFQDSALGKVPRGWEVGPITTRARLVSGGTPKTNRKEYWNGCILWASAKDVSQCSRLFLLETERTISSEGLAESATQLVAEFSTVVVARGATTGRMVLLGREMAMNQTCYALTTTANTPFWLYCLLRNAIVELVHGAHGSVFDTITTTSFASSRAVLPPQAVVEAFEAQITPLFRRILEATTESSNLAAIRDVLLPKLISGNIRLSDAMEIVEPVSINVESAPRPKHEATDEFKEAILIAALVRAIADSQHPLGRKRYNKFAYLVHRKAEQTVQNKFLKQAAGPYSPWMRYRGPEKIALKNRYVRAASVGKISGFVAAGKIAEIDRYLPKYGFSDSLDWAVNSFRYRTNDDLELLTTVDFAALELMQRGEPAKAADLRELIGAEPKWAPKLNRELFSEANIGKALEELRRCFVSDYRGASS